MTLPSHVSDQLGNRFVIERELGRGGMSTVYLAQDRKLGRPVALKVLRSDIAVEPARFAQEIRVTAQLQHPHILPLLDADDIGGYAYYVMPYVEGESLRDKLKRDGRMSLLDAVRLAREVAGALEHAHKREIVHRDIKPENILISAGHALVADFGIARIASSAPTQEPGITQAGLAVGTPAYMSPEQSLGDEVDGRTDIFSLGCVLYEMLTGRLPFGGGNAMGMLSAKMSGEVTPLTQWRDDVPEAVDVVLQRMLARDPDMRVPRAADVASELEAALTGTVLTPLPKPVKLPANAVAVLAFASMSPDTGDEYLAEGISEAIMHGLARVPGLRVIARTSAFALKGQALDVREIGARLKVRRVVEGSVRRAGQRLRVTAKLIDAETAHEVWSERFDRTLDDVFALEDDLAGAVAAQLRTLLMAEEGERLPTRQPQVAPTTSVAAYEQYLKGRFWWGQRTKAALERSVEHLQDALRIDSRFALAYAALAESYATMGLYGMAAPHEVAPTAREAANRALAIDPHSAGALCARACMRAFFEWDWEAAEQDFKAAMSADPQYPTAYQWYASTVLVPLGRFAEAQHMLSKAHDLDPLSLSIVVSRAAAAYYARLPLEAERYAREALAVDDRFAMGHFFLGLALEQSGALPDAQAALQRAVDLSGSVEAMAALASVLAARGERAEALALTQALEGQARSEYVSPVLLAQISVRTGDVQSALWHVQRAMELRAADLLWVGVRPVFDQLRRHPTWTGLLAELRLPGTVGPLSS
ncbi:protein kinase domain-containing protein [Gemmatimonas phototrophica]|nr:protein kinase [Gemmatimonas phototrophica]